MKVLSLFSGIGGLDLGLEMAGHKTIFANDIMKVACESYANYFRKYRNTKIYKPDEYNEILNNNSSKKLVELPIIQGDISKIKLFPEANIVTGGFPCQGFSMIGTRLETDPRNSLYLQFSRVVSIVRPEYFIAENVRGLMLLYGGKVFEAIKEKFKKDGYDVKAKLLNSKHYGVAQDRQRVIIVGVRDDLSKKGVKYSYPQPTHQKQNLNGQQLSIDDFKLKPLKTLKDEIGRFGEPDKSELHNAKFSPLYMSRNRRRKWDEVSFTIQANAMHVPLHPSSCEMVKEETDKFVFKPKNGKHRRLTPRECLAIQSFPSDYIKKIKGSVQQQYTQIGNAVPPLLAKAVAEKLPV